MYWGVSDIASDELGGVVDSVAGKLEGFDGVGWSGWYASWAGDNTLETPFSLHCGDEDAGGGVGAG